MGNSIEYIYEKSTAINNVQKILQVANIQITEEKEINNGSGYKFNCITSKKFGIIIYFKSGRSSRIVFENTPEEISTIFIQKRQHLIEENTKKDEPEQPAFPVYLSIKIASKDKVERIKTLLLETFKDYKESRPKDTITYKLVIQKNKNRFTVTQFENCTLLLQGVISPLFDEIKAQVHSVNPLTDVENALSYIPKNEQEKVQAAIDNRPDSFKNLYQQAQSRFSKDAFEYLYANDKQTIISAIGILNVVKEADLKIPLYNPILYPFAKAFEGFIIRLMIDKCFFTFEEYKANPNIAVIGNSLRQRKFEKYIKDVNRNGIILNKLETVWENLRCHELHSDPAQDDKIINLIDITQVENRIGEISGAIMDGYRVLVASGYTEDEMLALSVVNQTVNNKKTQKKYQNY